MTGWRGSVRGALGEVKLQEDHHSSLGEHVEAEWNHVHHVQSREGEDYLSTQLLYTELGHLSPAPGRLTLKDCELKASVNYTLLDSVYRKRHWRDKMEITPL